MASSLEKIQSLREELTAPPPADAPPLMMMLQTVIMMGGDQALGELIPETSEELDERIEWFAGKILELRSDPS